MTLEEFSIVQVSLEVLSFELSIVQLDLHSQDTQLCHLNSESHKIRFLPQFGYGLALFRHTVTAFETELWPVRPYSYSQYWTGTSLQWRLMRGNILKSICI